MGSQHRYLARRSVRSFRVCSDAISYLCAAFLSYNNRSADKTIKVWDIDARAAVSTVQDTGEVWSVSFRPQIPTAGSNGAFVSGGEDGVVRWWRGAGGGSV